MLENKSPVNLRIVCTNDFSSRSVFLPMLCKFPAFLTSTFIVLNSPYSTSYKGTNMNPGLESSEVNNPEAVFWSSGTTNPAEVSSCCFGRTSGLGNACHHHPPSISNRCPLPFWRTRWSAISHCPCMNVAIADIHNFFTCRVSMPVWALPWSAMVDWVFRCCTELIVSRLLAWLVDVHPWYHLSFFFSFFFSDHWGGGGGEYLLYLISVL